MKEKRLLALSVLTVTGCALFIIRKEAATEGFILSAQICVRSLVPSLFPFMIAADLLGKALGQRGESGVALQLLLGWLFGFPICAKAASQMYAEGKISYGAFRMMVCCGSIPSLPFTLGVCGNLFGVASGIALYFITLFSAMICLPFFDLQNGKEAISKDLSCAPISLGVEISGAISSCTLRMLSVCGYICFFSMVSAVLTESLGGVLTRCIVSGTLEFSGGVMLCADLGRTGFILCAAILSFSGLSVYMQILSMQLSAKLPATGKDYLLCKLLQAAISTLAAWGYAFRETTAGKFILCALLCVFLHQFFRILQLIYRKRLKKDKSNNIILTIRTPKRKKVR